MGPARSRILSALAESSLIGVWFLVAKLNRASCYKSNLMKRPIYAALDLHSRRSVLGSMNHDGQTQPRMRFPTEATILQAEVELLRQTLRLPTAGPARKSRAQKPLLSRLAYHLQIDYRTQCTQELLPAKPASHRQYAARSAQHPAQDFGDDVDNVAAPPAI
jgi:hypothetical protein